MLTGFIGMLSLLGLLFLGVPIAISAAFVGFMGLAYHTGSFQTALTLTWSICWDSMAHYSLSVIPLFIIMGQIAFHAGFMEKIFETMQAWFGRIRGGLGVATILASGSFAAMNGSSTASAVIMGKICVPQMLKHGYSREISTGAVVASGTLASLIPPSIVLVILGIMSQISIGRLLLAAYIPGAVSVIIYGIGLYVYTFIRPKWFPRHEKKYSLKEKIFLLRTIYPILVITAIIIGGIYSGLFTANEAAAVGCLAMLVMAFAVGKLTIRNLFEALKDSVRVTVLVLFIILGVSILSRFFAYSGLATLLATKIADSNLPSIFVLIGFLLLYFILGCFLDVIGMLVLTLPVFIPVATALNWDLIWFGILIVKACEVGLTTPPVGLNVYALATVTPDIPVLTIFRGVLLFFVLDVITIAILIAFPQITLILPNLMFR